MISSLSATLSAVLLVGYAGVHPSVGRGYEFIAITAVVLGGVVLGGGRGWVVAAVAGAFVLEALFLLLNIAGRPLVAARRGAGRHHHRRRRLLGARSARAAAAAPPTDFSPPRGRNSAAPAKAPRSVRGSRSPCTHALAQRARNETTEEVSNATITEDRHHIGGARRPLRPGRLHDRSERGSAGLVAEPTDDGGANEWFDQALFDKQMAQREVVPEGPEDEPYLQYIDAEMVDTSQYASTGAKKACFANASISNPWRQTGWITMNQQLEVLQEAGAISEMETRDAQDSDDTQIADIDYFISRATATSSSSRPTARRR